MIKKRKDANELGICVRCFKDKVLEDYKISMAADYKTDRISRGFTIAKRIAKISGDKRLHSLRHTYALKKLIELGDMHLVQKLLGHSNLSVTEVYTKFPKDYLKEIFINRYAESTFS